MRDKLMIVDVDHLIVQSPLGCNTILFAMAIYPRLNSPGHLRGVNRALLIIVTLLYSLCTAHFILVFIHFYDALVFAMLYSNYAFSELHSRIPQALTGFQTQKATSLPLISSYHSRVS